MRKLLLSALCAVAALGASATTATFTFTDATIAGWGYDVPASNAGTVCAADKPLTADGVTITVAQNAEITNEGQMFRFYNGNNGLDFRCSAKGVGHTLTFTASENITKIVFTNAKIALTPDTGTLTSGTWTGDAAAVVFTTTGANTFTQIEVTYGEGGGETPEPEPTVTEYETLTAWLAAKPADYATIKGAVTVTGQSANKKYTWITDGTSSIDIYVTADTEYKNGDQLTGIKGKYAEYKGLPELVPENGSLGTATTGTAVEPKVVALKDVTTAMACQYVKIENVNLTGSGSAWTATDADGNTLTVYYNANNFVLELAEKTGTTLEGFVSVYSTVQLLPTAQIGGTDGGETPEPTPDPTLTGDGTEENPYTVADVILLNNPGTEAWITGYIVGALNYNNNNSLEAETSVNTNICIAASADVTDKAQCVPVALPVGTVRDNLNLVQHPGNLGKQVWLKGKLEKYFGQPGMKETSDYSIEGGVAPEPEKEVASLTEWMNEKSASNVTITGAVTVTGQTADKKYTFITDGTSNVLVYSYEGLANEYVNGDQLTGIKGAYSVYKDMPQFVPVADTFGQATKGTAVEPAETMIDDVTPAAYVKLTDVNITDTDGTWTAAYANGEQSIQIFNGRFNIELTASEGATLIGFGSVFNGTTQILPTEEIPGDSSINEINAAAQANTIYDLQGRRVLRATRGLYIINGVKTLVK